MLRMRPSLPRGGNMDAMVHRLLNAQEVSDRLGIRLHRTYELVRDNQIPHVKIGRQVRVDATALEEWISSGGTIAESDR